MTDVQPDPPRGTPTSPGGDLRDAVEREAADPPTTADDITQAQTERPADVGVPPGRLDRDDRQGVTDEEAEQLEGRPTRRSQIDGYGTERQATRLPDGPTATGQARAMERLDANDYLNQLFTSGQAAPLSGRYRFVKYQDGLTAPEPPDAQRVVEVRQGEALPAIEGSDQPAVWQYAGRGDEAADEPGHEAGDALSAE